MTRAGALEQERELFALCLEQPPAEWPRLLRERCDDPALRDHVLKLLRRHRDTPAQEHSFLRLAEGDPESIGPYRILQRLGEGGMGIVYAAEQREPLRRRVALKVLRGGYNSREVLARFEAERQALSLMAHLNIASILDAGTTADHRPYIVMEFVPGEAITRYCARLNLPLRERLLLFRQVCDGVQHAHQKGVIHRDLKPSNILVMETPAGPVPKIIDFGVAKALAGRLTEQTLETKVGSLLGTPDYMSPEQADLSPLDIDTRADVYALGAVLYQLLTGVPPLQLDAAGGYAQLQKTIREHEPPAPSRRTGGAAAQQVRGELDWITLKALEKERNRRYSSAAELGSDIQRHLDGEVPLAGPHTWRYLGAKFARRHVVGVSIVIGAFVALAGFSALMSWQVYQTTYERNRANSEAEVSAHVTAFMLDLFRAADPEDAQSGNVSARELLDRASRSVREDLSLAPDVRLRLLAGLADAYRNMVRPADAIPLYREALQLVQARSDDAQRVRLLLALGMALNSQLQRDEARSVLREAMQLAQRAQVEDTDTLFALRYAMARATEDTASAVQMLRELHAEAGAHYGAAHRQTLRSGMWLVRAYLRDAELDQAEALARQLLPAARNVLGEQHFVTAHLLGSLGIIEIHRGNWGEAERLNRQVRDTLLARLGPDSVSTLYAEERLALSLADRQAGLRMLLALEQRYRRHYAPDSPQMIELLQNIGWIRLRIPGDETVALQVLEHARTLAETRLGMEHEVTTGGHYELAVAYARNGRPADALELLPAIVGRPQLQYWAAREPAFLGLHGDPAFVRLLGRFAPVAPARESHE